MSLENILRTTLTSRRWVIDRTFRFENGLRFDVTRGDKKSTFRWHNSYAKGGQKGVIKNLEAALDALEV